MRVGLMQLFKVNREQKVSAPARQSNHEIPDAISILTEITWSGETTFPKELYHQIRRLHVPGMPPGFQAEAWPEGREVMRRAAEGCGDPLYVGSNPTPGSILDCGVTILVSNRIIGPILDQVAVASGLRDWSLLLAILAMGAFSVFVWVVVNWIYALVPIVLTLYLLLPRKKKPEHAGYKTFDESLGAPIVLGGEFEKQVQSTPAERRTLAPHEKRKNKQH